MSNSYLNHIHRYCIASFVWVNKRLKADREPALELPVFTLQIQGSWNKLILISNSNFPTTNSESWLTIQKPSHIILHKKILQFFLFWTTNRSTIINFGNLTLDRLLMAGKISTYQFLPKSEYFKILFHHVSSPFRIFQI